MLLWWEPTAPRKATPEEGGRNPPLLLTLTVNRQAKRGKIQRQKSELKAKDRLQPVPQISTREVRNADSTTNIQPESNPVQQGRGKFSPPLLYNQVHNLNLSCVGNLIRSESQKPAQRINLQDNTRILIKTKLLKCGKALLYPYSDMQGKNTANLKKGGREALTRTTLTNHARRMILNAGDMIKWAIENDSRFISPIMITLTYGKAVPDHKTAKRHLNLFFNQCRKNKWLSHYVWVAQLQTGKRAKEKGQYSYRAENGSAIHFHIITMTERGSDLQLNNSQKALRAIWKKIVNDWEIRSGFPVQNIGGVDITAVHDSSRYVSRYTANESDTIIGNMWGMSAGMRELIKPTETYLHLPQVVFNDICKRVDSNKMYRVNAEGKNERIRIATGNTIAVKNWNNTYVLCTNDYTIIESEIKRYERNYGFETQKWSSNDKDKEEWIKQESANFAKVSTNLKYPRKNSVNQNANLHTTGRTKNYQKPVQIPVQKPVQKPVQIPVQTLIPI